MTGWAVRQQEGQRDFAHSRLRKLPRMCSTGSHELLSIQQTSVQPHKEVGRLGWDQRTKTKTTAFRPREGHFWDSTNYGLWGAIEEKKVRKDSGDRFGDFCRCFYFLRDNRYTENWSVKGIDLYCNIFHFIVFFKQVTWTQFKGRLTHTWKVSYLL